MKVGGTITIELSVYEARAIHEALNVQSVTQQKDANLTLGQIQSVSDVRGTLGEFLETGAVLEARGRRRVR